MEETKVEPIWKTQFGSTQKINKLKNKQNRMEFHVLKKSVLQLEKSEFR